MRESLWQHYISFVNFDLGGNSQVGMGVLSKARRIQSSAFFLCVAYICPLGY